MVDWQSPETLAANYEDLIRLGHLACGIYIWEWVANLDFDYALIARARTFKLPIAVYLVCRLAALLTAILTIAMLNITYDINCRVLYKIYFIVAYICWFTPSILVALRTIAIWNRSRYVSVLLALALLAYCGVLLYVEIVGPSGAWSQAGTCASSHDLNARSLLTFAFVFDVICLGLALVGARACWDQPTGALWSALYHQGIVWIFIIVIAYTVPLAFLWLNLNLFMNNMFQMPAAVTLVIAATRMYRGLYEVANANSNVIHFLEPTTSGGMRVEDYAASVDQSAANHHGQSDDLLIEMGAVKSSASGIFSA